MDGGYNYHASPPPPPRLPLRFLLGGGGGEAADGGGDAAAAAAGATGGDGEEGGLDLSPAADIDWSGMLVAAVPVAAVAAVSLLLKLGNVRTLLVAACRCVAQLLLLGLILVPVFEYNRVYVVVPYLGAMALFATRESYLKPKLYYIRMKYHMLKASVVCLVVMSALISFGVLRPNPWYDAQVVIPVAGMMLGSSVNALSLGMDRFLLELLGGGGGESGGGVHGGSARLQTYQNCGANKWERSVAAVRQGIVTGLTPNLNQMSVMGLVSIPGMLTGQLLAGTPPLVAAKYQIVIMFFVSSNSFFILFFVMLQAVYSRCLFFADGAGGGDGDGDSPAAGAAGAAGAAAAPDDDPSDGMLSVRDVDRLRCDLIHKRSGKPRDWVSALASALADVLRRLCGRYATRGRHVAAPRRTDGSEEDEQAEEGTASRDNHRKDDEDPECRSCSSSSNVAFDAMPTEEAESSSGTSSPSPSTFRRRAQPAAAAAAAACYSSGTATSTSAESDEDCLLRLVGGEIFLNRGGTPSSRRPLLSGLNLALREREIVLVTGPSGCGKSTFLRALALLEDMRFRGLSLRRQSPTTAALSATAWRGEVVYVRQNGGQGLSGTPREILADLLSLHAQKARSRQYRQQQRQQSDQGARDTIKTTTTTTTTIANEEVEGEHCMIDYLKVLDLPRDMIDRRWDMLSGGEAQRVYLCMMLALRPSVLLLDEPTSACDEESARRVEDLIVRSEIAVLWVSHDPAQMQRLEQLHQTSRLCYEATRM